MLAKDEEEVRKAYDLAQFYLTKMVVFCKYANQVVSFTDEDSVKHYKAMVVAGHELSKHFVLMDKPALSSGLAFCESPFRHAGS